MNALAIINPTAGGGRSLNVWSAVRPRFLEAGWTVTDATAERRGHETELAAGAARDGYDVVLAVGGDGTAHWAANGLLRHGGGVPSPTPSLAVVPAGTGGDFAGAMGLPKDPQAAVAALLRGKVRRIDVGLVNGRYFLTIGTVGFGGEVARQVNEWPKRLPGPVMYIAAILKMLVTYSPVEVEVVLDGRARRQRLFMVGVGNTYRAAGGMKLCPGATPDDQIFEVVLIGNVTKLEVLGLLPKTFPGRHIFHPKVEVANASTITVNSSTPLAVQADGELIGTVPATFTVLPQALEVLAPTGGPAAQ